MDERKVPKATAFYSERKTREQGPLLVGLLKKEIIRYLIIEKGVTKKDLNDFKENARGGLDYDMKKLSFFKTKLGVERALWFYVFLSQKGGVNENIILDNIIPILSNYKDDFPKGLKSSDELRFYLLKTIYSYLFKLTAKDFTAKIEPKMYNEFNERGTSANEEYTKPPVRWKNDYLIDKISNLINKMKEEQRPSSSIGDPEL